MASPEEPETKKSYQSAWQILFLLEKQERLDVEGTTEERYFFTIDSEILWYMCLGHSVPALFNMEINFVMSTWTR